MALSTDNAQDFSFPSNRSALAIFCRAPRLGTVKTRLAASFGNDFSLGLYEAMLQDTFALGSALAPDVEIFACFTPSDGFEGVGSLSSMWSGLRLAQCDGGLGEKMLDAFQQLRTKGFEQILLIGSDSPDLPSAHLKSAFEALDVAPGLVFGPASDGGFTLIGASIVVPPSLFEGVPWSHHETLNAVRRRNELRGSDKFAWTEVDEWQDVDEVDDLIALRHRLFEMGTFAPNTKAFLEKHTSEIAKAQGG